MRTVYRDIRTLIDLGAPVEGEAGLGYLLRAGFFLPPLMFGEEELEALVLGARWVRGPAMWSVPTIVSHQTGTAAHHPVARGSR